MSCIPKPRKKSAKKSPIRSFRKPRQRWTEEETKLLIKCVEKHGKKWAYIHKNYPLFKKNGRTETDLKDKYRNLENAKIKYCIYSLENCSYCREAKKLLEKNNLPYKEIKVYRDDIKDILKILESKTNKYGYFPIIFYNKKFLGGFQELQKQSSEIIIN
jgi:glutaredoxin